MTDRCKLYPECGSSNCNCNDDFDAIRFCEKRMRAKIETVRRIKIEN